jgi:hypothetical protein
MSIFKMYADIDILDINNKIMQNFETEIKKLDEYKSKRKELENSLSIESIPSHVKEFIEKSIKNLSEHIVDIETNKFKNFYTIETAEILEKYKSILKKPQKINFIGKTVKHNKEKDVLIASYLEIANKYVQIDYNFNFTSDKKDKIVCKNCNNSKDFEIQEGNIYICLQCSAQQFILKNVTSYKDINRVNISSKYIYDRKIHFRDCINQYQGKQNSTIHQDVYNDIEKQLELHYIIDPTITNKKEKFKNVTKEHITIFLKDLGYTKHYENVNLIHYNLTGIKPDDISYIEDKLLTDFDIITEAYDKLFKHLDRKNFINTQYILYQLLLRHKHPCKKEDFSILKTIDRKNFHDEICKQLFEYINFTFHPCF